MKADTHPKYIEAKVTCSCGNTFTTRSTKPSCTPSCATSATRSTPASRSSSTPVAGSSASSVATAGAPRGRPAADRGAGQIGFGPTSLAVRFEGAKCSSRSTELVAEYDDVVRQLYDPAVISDHRRFRDVSRRHQELEPVVDAYRAYRNTNTDLERPRRCWPTPRATTGASGRRDHGRGEEEGRARGGAQGPPPAEGPQRRQERHRRDPRRRGRRGGQPLRPRTSTRCTCATPSATG